MTHCCYAGCDGGPKPATSILEVPAAFDKGQVREYITRVHEMSSLFTRLFHFRLLHVRLFLSVFHSSVFWLFFPGATDFFFFGPLS